MMKQNTLSRIAGAAGIMLTALAVFAALGACENPWIIDTAGTGEEQAGSPADTTAPAEVSNLSAASSTGQVILTWIDPTDADLDHIEITWTPDGASPVTVAPETQTKTVTGLDNGMEYTFTVKAVDTAGNKSAGETETATPADTTAPAEVSSLSAVPGIGEVTLTWTDPTDADLDHIEITWTPDDDTTVTVPAATGMKTVTGLANGMEYTFTVKAVDTAGNKSAGETETATPADTLNSVAAVAYHLAAASGGANAADPVPLPVNLELSDTGWEDLLSAIDGADKYVALDLSACARGTQSSGNGLRANGTFDPGTANTGEPYVTALTLPDAAESIQAGDISNPVFKNFTALTELNGENVVTVGNYAFRACHSLETVNLPAAITIGSSAFSFCDALSAVSIPNAKTIGSNAFSFCALTSVDLLEAETIDGAAFIGCTALSSVSIPKAKIIGHSAFSFCAMSSVNLPNSLTSIGTGAFENCTALTSIALPAGLISIGLNPFMSCVNLNDIQVDPANPAFKGEGGMLLNKAGTTLIGYPGASGTVTLTGGITVVQDFAFSGCTALTSADLPAATIGNRAFFECTSLSSVSLPVAVTIGERAFEDCTALTSVDLPAVGTINSYAFYYCTALSTLSLPASPPVLGGTGIFFNTNSGAGAGTTLTIKVPSTPPGVVGAYESAWGVDEDTAANGNAEKYGTNHKRILITDL
jgi:hypothetical protein